MDERETGAVCCESETEQAEVVSVATESPLPEDDSASLHAEIERLQGEVRRLNEIQARSRQELDEFCSLYPHISLSALPDEVRQQADAGVPLSAAYALFEKREAYRREAGKKSAESSWRGMNGSASGEYYSPAEVKGMSQKEVHKNYKKIIESMKHWK